MHLAIKLFLKYISFGVPFAVIHYFLSFRGTFQLSLNTIFSVHLINFFFSLTSAFILMLTLPKMKNQIGFIFIGLSTLKFFIIVLYLIHFILTTDDVNNLAIQLVCISVLYLVFDVKWIITQINKGKP